MAASLGDQVGQVWGAGSLRASGKQMLRWTWRQRIHGAGKAWERWKGEDAGLSKTPPAQEPWHTGCPESPAAGRHGQARGP